MEQNKKIRVAVLLSGYEASNSEFKALDTYERSPAFFYPEPDSPYTFKTIPINKATSYSQIRALVHSQQFDVFFNLCDGEKYEDRAGDDVVRALEEFNVPFTGVDLEHYSPSKPEMKMIAYYNNIKTPNFFVVEDVPSMDELRRLTSALKFPLIVKHPNASNSIGMTRDSKCTTIEDLLREISLFVKNFNTAMVEEFIIGDEITTLAVATPSGTKALPPLRIVFPPGEDFKHFDLKWKTYNDMGWAPLTSDDPACAEINRVTKVAFDTILGGVSYGRCDLRVDRTTNEVYLLEINSYPLILYQPGGEASADWILRLDPTFNHRDFIKAAIDTAILSHRKRQPLHKLNFDPIKGYYVVAACPISKGTVVFADEGKAFPIVTRPYVESNWSDAEKENFSQYGWPLSSDGHVYAIRENDPSKWRPLSHSCEPNVVFAAPHSLNCIAARDIERSEELTMDYATFCDVRMKPFDCRCGTASCRGRISVTEDVIRKYGDHAWHRSIPKVVM